MFLGDILEKLKLEIITGEIAPCKTIGFVNVCDVLSDVIAKGQQDDLWITMQTHQNIIAVASFLNFAAILLPENLTPEADTLQKAKSQGITILKSPKSAFDLAGELYTIGLRGRPQKDQ